MAHETMTDHSVGTNDMVVDNLPRKKFKADKFLKSVEKTREQLLKTDPTRWDEPVKKSQ